MTYDVYVQTGDDEGTRRLQTKVPSYLQFNAVIVRLGFQRDDVLSATLTIDGDRSFWLVRVAP
jgi:hypothetical protein